MLFLHSYVKDTKGVRHKGESDFLKKKNLKSCWEVCLPCQKTIRVCAWALRDAVHDELRQSAFQMRGAAVELINGRGGTRGTEIIFMG